MTREHGRYATYRRGCRCDECRRANTDYAAVLRRRSYAGRTFVAGRWIAPISQKKHGTADAYSRHGCRCIPCTHANREHQASRRAS